MFMEKKPTPPKKKKKKKNDMPICSEGHVNTLGLLRPKLI